MNTIKTIAPGNIESTGIKSTLKMLLYTLAGTIITAIFATIYHWNFGGYEAIAMAILPPIFVFFEKLLLPYSIVVTDPLASITPAAILPTDTTPTQ